MEIPDLRQFQETARNAYVRCASCSGFTLLELLVVLMLSAILGSIAINNLTALANPAQGAAAQIGGFLREVRAKAISQTVAYRVTPVNARRLATSFANSCSAGTFTSDNSLTLQLPNGSQLTTTNWTICFNSRGLADANQVLSLSDNFVTHQVEVMLGGGVRVQ